MLLCQNLCRYSCRGTRNYITSFKTLLTGCQTMSLEISTRPLFKQHAIALLNTLFPPSAEQLPNEYVEMPVLSMYRRKFIRSIKTASVVGALGLAQEEVKAQWEQTRNALDTYLRMALLMIEQASAMTSGIRVETPTLTARLAPENFKATDFVTSTETSFYHHESSSVSPTTSQDSPISCAQPQDSRLYGSMDEPIERDVLQTVYEPVHRSHISLSSESQTTTSPPITPNTTSDMQSSSKYSTDSNSWWQTARFESQQSLLAPKHATSLPFLRQDPFGPSGSQTLYTNVATGRSSHCRVSSSVMRTSNLTTRDSSASSDTDPSGTNLDCTKSIRSSIDIRSPNSSHFQTVAGEETPRALRKPASDGYLNRLISKRPFFRPRQVTLKSKKKSETVKKEHSEASLRSLSSRTAGISSIPRDVKLPTSAVTQRPQEMDRVEDLPTQLKDKTSTGRSIMVNGSSRDKTEEVVGKEDWNSYCQLSSGSLMSLTAAIDAASRPAHEKATDAGDAHLIMTKEQLAHGSSFKRSDWLSAPAISRTYSKSKSADQMVSPSGPTQEMENSAIKHPPLFSLSRFTKHSNPSRNLQPGTDKVSPQSRSFKRAGPFSFFKRSHRVGRGHTQQLKTRVSRPAQVLQALPRQSLEERSKEWLPDTGRALKLDMNDLWDGLCLQREEMMDSLKTSFESPRKAPSPPEPGTA